MKRCSFLIAFIVLVTTIVLSPVTSFAVETDTATFTIFHTSDIHGATSVSKSSLPNIANIINAARNDATNKGDGNNVILTDGGDTLQGSLDSTYFNGGEQVIKALRVMNYDYMCVGNHEFNFGIDNLNARVAQATATESDGETPFKILCSNISGIEGVLPYYVDEISYTDTSGNPVKVAFVGVANEGTIKSVEREKNITGITFADPITTVKPIVEGLKSDNGYGPNKDKADIVIVLTHQDIEDDKALAEAVPSIDIMLGAHKHHLYTPNANQFETTKSSTTPVPTNFPEDVIYMQGRNATNSLIQLTVKYDVATGKVSVVDTDADETRLYVVPSSKYTFVDTIEMPTVQDASIKALLEEYEITGLGDKSGLTEYKSEVIAVANGDFNPLSEGQLSKRRGVSDLTMGVLVATFVKEYVGADVGMEELWTNTVFQDGQNITRGATFGALPYENVVMKATLNPIQLKAVLEANAAVYGDTFFCSVSGMKVEYDMYKPIGSRVKTITLDGDTAPLDVTDTTRVITMGVDSNMTSGGNGFKVFKELNIPLEDNDYWTRESFMNWIESKGTINADDYRPNDITTINIFNKSEYNLENEAEEIEFFIGAKDGHIDTTIEIVNINGEQFAANEAPVKYENGQLVPLKSGSAVINYTGKVNKLYGVTNYGGKSITAKANVTVKNLSNGDNVYIVKSGDVLWRIAQKYNTTWQVLADINSLDNPNLIYVGDVLYLP